MRLSSSQIKVCGGKVLDWVEEHQGVHSVRGRPVEPGIFSESDSIYGNGRRN